MIFDDRIKIVAFDADDTLWENETLYRATEREFCKLLSSYMDEQELICKLFSTEISNLPSFGYGIKSFILSMVETALKITDYKIESETIEKIIDLGRKQINMPVQLLSGVKEVLDAFYGRYRLVLATKGELLEQERKLNKSGLRHYFHHIEIMSEKNIESYKEMLKHLDCRPEEFLMIGNSIKSDILPVLELGGNAIHIPFHITWQHEEVDCTIDNPRFMKLTSITDLL